MRSTKRLVLISVFVALIIVGGLISVPIPFTQIQLSFQVVFVLAAGMLLGGRDGALAVLIYIVMGLVGLPVFTQGGGIGYVLMPSFGYLLGFPLGALVCGTVCGRGQKSTRGRAFFGALLGMIPIYVLGVGYQIAILYFYVGSAWSAVVGGLPAIAVLALKDAVLCGVAASLYPALRRALRIIGLRNSENKKIPLASK